MNLFKRIWGRIIKKGENKMAEQEQKTARPKKAHKFVLPLALAAVVAATGLGVGGCKNDLTGSGVERPDDGNWGEWKAAGDWIKVGDIAEWITDEAATWDKPGEGHKETAAKYKQAQSRTHLTDPARVETRTVEEEWYRTEVPGTRKEIPIGHVLNKESGNLELMAGTAVTLANADALLQNNLDMLVALRNSQVDNIAGMDASTGIQNDDAISLVGGTLGDLARQAKGLEEYLSAAATANAGNITGAKFGELAAIEGLIKARASGVNGTVGNTVKDYATARAGQIGAMLDSIFGTTGDAREGFDEWFDLYQKGQYLRTRDWPTEFAKEGANAADRIQYPNGHLVDTNDKGIMGAGLVAAFAAAGEDIDDISHNSGINGGNGRGTRFEEMDFDLLGDFLKNIVEPELKNRIISALGIGGVTNAEILAMALVYQLGDGAEYGAFIDDLVAANDKKFINVSDILNGNFTFSLTTQSRSQSAGVRLARVGAGFDFPTESIKGAYGAEYTGAFTPYRKDEQIV